MQKAKMVFLIFIFLFSYSFYLVTKDYTLKGFVTHESEVVVFYNDNGALSGSFLPGSNPVEDIFSYLTVKQNSAPVGHLSPLNLELNLVKYYDLNDKLILTLSTEFINYQKEIPLLYESYHILGFDYLEIHTPKNTYLYDEVAIFNLESYTNYDNLDTKGEVTYLYKLKDEQVTFSVTKEEDPLAYLISSCMSSYEDNKLILYFKNKDELFLLELNFQNFSYLLAQKS